MNYLQLATQYLESNLTGRYITLNHIEPLFKSFPNIFQTEIIGYSAQQKPIYGIKVGQGTNKVLMWSQMHGNESTTTKGLFDFFNFLCSDNHFAFQILKKYTLYCIPILNPDGAALYTRENANKVDLNRDAKVITQPESKVLRQVVEDFQPNLCFNLHDQRTIFGAGDLGFPATVSFLAPAYNSTRDFNETRLKAITIINCVYKTLQEYIPNQIGRFNDDFNENCIGDYLTTRKIPTILFEAGHFQNDYNREEVRKFIFIAILTALNFNEKNKSKNNLEQYLEIPPNKKNFYDFYYKNIKVLDLGIEKIINFVAQYEEILKDNKIEFIAKIKPIEKSSFFYGHYELDGKNQLFESHGVHYPIENNEANFTLNKKTKFNNGLKQI